VVETSSGKGLIEYLHGAGQILPALRVLEGMKVSACTRALPANTAIPSPCER